MRKFLVILIVMMVSVMLFGCVNTTRTLDDFTEYKMVDKIDSIEVVLPIKSGYICYDIDDEETISDIEQYLRRDGTFVLDNSTIYNGKHNFVINSNGKKYRISLGGISERGQHYRFKDNYIEETILSYGRDKGYIM